ncbi:unnamed protein product [Brachionus calyciflorus]|uniref:Uncharacterized protein n=1 Tax=Brachionus calyciflorus TaxID=104777 RepID=A0A813Z7N7_9BILA|nr:unnamed protein product [Brachionus calyciflorus]
MNRQLGIILVLALIASIATLTEAKRRKNHHKNELDKHSGNFTLDHQGSNETSAENHWGKKHDSSEEKPDRPNKPNWTHKPHKPGKPHKPHKGKRPGKPQKPNRPHKENRPEHSELHKEQNTSKSQEAISTHETLTTQIDN